ncbi:hypothetical protein NL676_023096 [Syzygium grande]|nr:hypothetical protein NL676_023096 [Syzygium grande]
MPRRRLPPQRHRRGHPGPPPTAPTPLNAPDALRRPQGHHGPPPMPPSLIADEGRARLDLGELKLVAGDKTALTDDGAGPRWRRGWPSSAAKAIF